MVCADVCGPVSRGLLTQLEGSEVGLVSGSMLTPILTISLLSPVIFPMFKFLSLYLVTMHHRRFSWDKNPFLYEKIGMFMFMVLFLFQFYFPMAKH